MLKAIFFDLDDTLLWDKKSIKTAFEKTSAYAAQLSGVDCTALEEAVRQKASNLYRSYETYPFTQLIGINPFEGLWGSFDDAGEDFQKMKALAPGYQQQAWTLGLKKLGIDDPEFGQRLAAYFTEARKSSPFVYEDTFRVLDQLKPHYQLLLLTNGSPQLQQTKLEITPEIAPYFDHIVISGAFGKGKPDPEIFHYALSKFDLSAEDVLMVGDNLMTDILGAEQAGIRSVWINREQKQPHHSIIPTYEIKQLDELFPILENL